VATRIRSIIDDAQRAANNSVNQLIRTPQGVYMRARMDIDADGSPRARQIDPTGQTKTSMRYTDGSSINAEEVPYMVLPGGQYSQFGIKLGDMCLVRNKENGKVTVAVFADVGPRQKRGEGSMKLAEELGINNSPTRGGITRPNIEYLVLPGSGYPAQNQSQLLARINAQKQRLGLA
jgi:Fungal chitosanase of glycosyl hydrolase group 75